MGVEVLRGEPDDVIGLSGVRDAVDLSEELVIERFGLFPLQPGQSPESCGKQRGGVR